MISITKTVFIAESEIELSAIRAQGSGGQHVNKVSTAIHLRFDVKNSSLPEVYKIRILASHDYRLTAEGIMIIKAQRYKSQEQNKLDAIERLVDFIQQANKTVKKRKKTKPTKGSVKRRVDAKTQRGRLKKLRQLDF